MLLNLQQETQENTVQQQQQDYPLNEKELLTSEYSLLQVYLCQKKKNETLHLANIHNRKNTMI